MYYIMYREPNDFQVKTWDIRAIDQIPLVFNILRVSRFRACPKRFQHTTKKGAFSAPTGITTTSHFRDHILQSDRTPPIDATPLPVDSYPS